MKSMLDRLRNQNLVFIGTIILTIVVGQIIIQYDLNKQNEDARLINIAGRQRMLSQRISKLVLYIHNDSRSTDKPPFNRIDTLRNLITNWKEVHELLVAKSSNGENSAEIDSLLKINTPRLNATIQACENIINHPDAITIQAGVDLIALYELPYLLTMEKTVATYQMEAEEKLNQLKIAEILLSILAIIVLIMEFVIIFLPTLKKLKQSNEDFSQSNQELSSLNEELQASEEEIRANLDQINILQEHLQSSERQFRELVNNAQDMIYELDTEGKFTFVNPVIESATEFSKEELLSKHYWDIIHPDCMQEVIRFYQKQRKELTELSYLETRLLSRSGTEIWIGQNVRMIFEERRVIKVSAMARDITKLKKAEQKMEESETRYRLLSENSSDVVSLNDLDGRFEYISPACIDLHEYTPEELIGRKGSEFMTEEGTQMVQKQGPLLRKKMERNESIPPMQFQLITKSGKVVWVENAMKPVFKNGQLTGFQSTLRNISERKKVEEDLLKAKEKAEEATLAKSQFLSMMSHEIRTPLNAIIGITNIMLDEKPREDQLESLKLLKFSGENLLTIINDILDFSKIEAGKIELETISFNIRELFQHHVNLLEARVQDKGIEVQLLTDKNIPELLLGDPVRIGQIINNLVSNAIKFTEKGYVEISISQLKKTSDQKSDLLISVKDTGIGIPKEKLESVFESFTQASSDTTRKFGGTGLGLSITRKLLHLMGSEVNVESQYGYGSTFSFELTLETSTEIPAGKEKSISAHSHFSSAKILLVEDNRVNQIVASNFLKKWGIELTIANNGKEAVNLIVKKGFDMVLMDLQMPEMDGYEATRTIRQMGDEYFKNIPIIALTASAMMEIKEKTAQVGMTDYVSKPFQPEELQSKIGKYLKKKISKSNHSAISMGLELYSEGDLTFKKELAGLLIKNIAELKQSLERTFITNDESEFNKTSHKVKTTLSMLGDMELEKTVEKLQVLLAEKENKKEIDPKILNQFFQLCTSAIQGLEDEIKDINLNT
ncbi:MAG TPA: PAS domain S-box protein [Cyclobacteriaceae bacterium]